MKDGETKIIKFYYLIIYTSTVDLVLADRLAGRFAGMLADRLAATGNTGLARLADSAGKMARANRLYRATADARLLVGRLANLAGRLANLVGGFVPGLAPQFGDRGHLSRRGFTRGLFDVLTNEYVIRGKFSRRTLHGGRTLGHLL